MTEDEVLTASGLLSIADPDAGESFFRSETVTGAHGSLTLTPDGSWTYEVDNDLPAVQSLGGETLTDTVTVTSSDGTEQNIDITITGTNDVPVIGGDVSGSVIEDDALTASGQLAITDADAFFAFFNEDTVSGAHGSLTITSDGAWSYTADNAQPAVQGLGEGAQLTDTVTVTSLDGTEQSIEITITGTNDVPVICGEFSGSVVEDEVLQRLVS